MSLGSGTRRDLAVLVPDADTARGVAALLSRHRSLQIREISFTVYRHEERDAGCFRRSQDYLRPLSGKYHHALVLFDRDGCGSSASAERIEADVRARIEQVGWSGRCDVVVIDPELEQWVWSDSPKVAEALGWCGTTASLREWLEERDLWNPEEAKPSDPKAAVEEVQRQVGRRRTPRLYAGLAASVSTRGCKDPSFNRFVQILRGWFPADK